MGFSRVGFVVVALVVSNSGAVAQESTIQLDAIQQAIREAEYRVTWQDQTVLPDLDAAWHAANRAQNLRFYFTEDGVRVVDRTADGSPELLQLGFRMPQRNWQATPAIENGSANLVVDRVGFVESFTNGSTGLEQMLTINRLPESEGPIELDLSWTAAGITVTDSSVEFTTGVGRRLVFSVVEARDATGAELEARFSTDGDRLLLIIDHTGGVAPFSVKNLLTGTANTILEGNIAGRLFGSEVAVGDVNGDGFADVAVAVTGWDNGQDNEGAVMVFHGGPGGISSNGSGPIGPAANTVIEPNEPHYQWPGSLAIVGDVNGDGFEDLVAGSSRWDPMQPPNLSTYWGAIWVFHGSASGIAATGLGDSDGFVASDRTMTAFGEPVRAAGDVNGDGYADVIVGASSWDDVTPSIAPEGAAFVFHGSSSGITATSTSQADARLEGNSIGVSAGHDVTGLGDVDGDGFDDVAVSLPGLSHPESYEGGVAILHGSSTGVASNATDPLHESANTLIEGNIANGSSYEVAAAGDVNGDGFNDVVVGLRDWGDSVPHAGEGLVAIFHGSPTGVASNGSAGFADSADTAIEGNPNPHVSLWFAWKISGASDLNGDGFADITVGASGFSNSHVDEGAVFVFLGSADGIPSSRTDPVEEVADLVVDGDMPQVFFGFETAMAGDVNGDGFDDLVIPCSSYSSPESTEGAVFIYHGGAESPAESSDLQLHGQQAGEIFGTSVVSAGDVNGDGFVDLAVGAPWFDGSAEDVGRVFVFHGSPPPVTGSPAWTASGTQAFSNFGASVASAGDVNGDGFSDLAVGTPYAANPDHWEGRVDVFLGSPSGLSTSSEWTHEGGQMNAQFGLAVAAAGDSDGDGYGDLLIGAPGYSNGQSFEGRAYLFRGSQTGLSDAPSWTFEIDQDDAYLGASVAGAGDVNGDGFADVLIGAPRYSSGQSYEGAVFGFNGSGAGLSTGPSWSAESDSYAAYFGHAVAGAGDINGDGFGDIVVGTQGESHPESGEGRVYVFQGSQTGLPAVADTILELNIPDIIFGFSVDGAGDVNGDGFSDIVVGAPGGGTIASTNGRAYLFFGTGSGIAVQPAWSVAGAAPKHTLGWDVAGIGDFNGDGFSDVVVGIPSQASPTDNGWVNLYLGNGGAGRPVLARQFRGADDPTPVQPWGLTHSGADFQVSVTATSPRGRELAKLHVEACPPGEVWGDVDCRHAVSDAWTAIPLGEEGAVLTETISSLTDGALYRWRAHVLYLPLHADEPGITEPPVPRHGPWRRLFAMAPAADIRVGEPQQITIEVVNATSSVPESAAYGEVDVVVTTSDGAPTEIDSSVDYETHNGTAFAGDDFVHTSWNLFFPSGTASGTVATIQVDLIGDALDEADEDFILEIYSPTGAFLGPQTTDTVTILDDDPPPELSAATVEVDEGAGFATITLELSAPTSFEVTVNYSTNDDTATAPEDYSTASGTATIPPLDSTATVGVDIEEDWLEEGDEVFTLELSGVAHATLMTPTVEVIIHDNDSGIVFADGFEAGDTTMWSKTVP